MASWSKLMHRTDQSAIDMSKASALAAFRAGRRAGQYEALRILVDLMDEISDVGLKTTLYEAAALAADEPPYRTSDDEAYEEGLAAGLASLERDVTTPPALQRS